MGGGASKFDKTKIGRHYFEFFLIIGQGGFGKVHAGAIPKKHLKPVQWYAIKQMSKNEVVKKGEAGLAMLINELTILRTLNSPHLINAYTAFQDDQDCYIVMDLMLGGDIRYYLKRNARGFEESAVKFFVATFIISIEACHELKILHRDIKPDNMVLDANGYGRLTDFGIAAQLKEEENYVCKVGSGTLGYMAPEQASKTHEHSFPADWWQLGIVAQELLTGGRPQPNSGPTKKLVNYVFEEGQKEPKNTDELDEKWALDEPGKGGPECTSFIAALLDPRPWMRMSDIEKIKGHEWLSGFDWDGLEKRTMKVPIKPRTDQVNCDMGNENAEDMMGLAPKRAKLTEEQQAIFNTYDWNTELGEEGVKNIGNVLKMPVSDTPVGV